MVMGKVALARIDERLVHGQVMTNLSKNAGANAIFIVDDPVSKDEFMKTIFINSGSRTGLKVKIFSVEDAVRYWKEKQFENFKVILLVKNIETIYQLVKKGIPVEELNVGGIAKRPNTTSVINAVAIDKEQVEKLRELRDGFETNIYFQAVPSNKKVSLNEALKLFK